MDVSHNTALHDETVTSSGVKTIVNLIALFFVIAGTVFKMMYWRGADMLILISTVALLATIYYLYRDMQHRGNDSTTSLMLSAFMFLLAIGTLFRRFHWQGATIMAVIVGAFAVIAALYLILRRGEVRLPKQFGIVTLIYLLYISGAGFLSSRASQILNAALDNQ